MENQGIFERITVHVLNWGERHLLICLSLSLTLAMVSVLKGMVVFLQTQDDDTNATRSYTLQANSLGYWAQEKKVELHTGISKQTVYIYIIWQVLGRHTCIFVCKESAHPLYVR